jgi:hypothetical protein
MQRNDVLIAYTAYYISNMRYTLVATKLSKKQCDKIQSPPHLRHPQQDGYQFIGLAMTDVFILQGTNRLHYLIGRITNSNRNGQLMRICIEFLQLGVGTFTPTLFLQHNTYDNGLINRKWLPEIWAHLSSFNSKITLTNQWIPKPQREDDVAIMAAAHEYTT